MSPAITNPTTPNDWRVGMFSAPDIAAQIKPDGEIRLASRMLPSPAARTTLDWLSHWAAKAADAVFVTEAVGEEQGRKTLTYGQAWQDSGRIGAGLLASGLVPGDCLIVVAPNGIFHMQVALGALRSGIIYVPIAVQYAAKGADPSKLAAVLDVIRPAGAFVDGIASSPLLADIPRLFAGSAGLASLLDQGAGRAPPDIASLNPEAPAKLLLTSGSTGTPKAVPYSHALMTHNTQATIDVWPFVTQHKPVLVDWLPWNHAFGGSNNVHLVLSQGGTLHVDPSGGRPDKLALSIEALRRFRPTFHGAVPAGWAALLPTIEADAAFRQAFFGRLDVMFSAGAAMSSDLFDRLSRASALVRGCPVPIVTGWGSTETGPGATMVHDLSAQPGCIGTPMPGVEIRLMRHGDKHELRVRGKSVMTGYWGRPDLSANIFDDEGFFCTGDAGRLVDPAKAELGLMFDGRLLDDFKLANGSWVNASALRMSLMQRAGGALRDVVIIGADKPHVAALCWVEQAEILDELFAAHNRQSRGQTMRVERFAALSTPPDAAAGELTPKGEINKKVLLGRRADAVAALYGEEIRCDSR